MDVPMMVCGSSMLSLDLLGAYRDVRKEPNITLVLAEPGSVPGRAFSAPMPAARPLPVDRTTATESGKSLANRIGDEQAADALEFHIRRLGLGEHGVRHESVIGEHRVVASHVCFGKPHALMLTRGSR